MAEVVGRIIQETVEGKERKRDRSVQRGTEKEETIVDLQAIGGEERARERKGRKRESEPFPLPPLEVLGCEDSPPRITNEGRGKRKRDLELRRTDEGDDWGTSLDIRRKGASFIKHSWVRLTDLVDEPAEMRRRL